MKLFLTVPYVSTLSVNSYKGRNRAGGEYTKPEVSLWGVIVKSGINSCVPSSLKPEMISHEHPFELNLDINFPKKFGTRSGDASNFDKVSRDAVARALGVDDAGSTGTPSATYGHGDDACIKMLICIFGVDGNPISSDTFYWECR